MGGFRVLAKIWQRSSARYSSPEGKTGLLLAILRVSQPFYPIRWDPQSSCPWEHNAESFIRSAAVEKELGGGCPSSPSPRHGVPLLPNSVFQRCP